MLKDDRCVVKKKVVKEVKKIIKEVIIEGELKAVAHVGLKKEECAKANRRWEKNACTEKCTKKILKFSQELGRCLPTKEDVIEVIKEHAEETCTEGFKWDKKKKTCVVDIRPIRMRAKTCRARGLRYTRKSKCIT